MAVELSKSHEHLNEFALEEYAGGIQVTFFKSSTETVKKSVEKIITLMAENPYITQKELSLAIGLSRWGVEKNISKLKKRGQNQSHRPSQRRPLGNHSRITVNLFRH